MMHSCQGCGSAHRILEPRPLSGEDVDQRRVEQDASGTCWVVVMPAHRCPVQADEMLLAEADPERIYVDALSGFPYLMTPAQVASFTQTTPAGVRKLLASGELKGSRMGARWVVPKLCLLRYLNGNRRQAGD